MNAIVSEKSPQIFSRSYANEFKGLFTPRLLISEMRSLNRQNDKPTIVTLDTDAHQGVITSTYIPVGELCESNSL